MPGMLTASSETRSVTRWSLLRTDGIVSIRRVLVRCRDRPPQGHSAYICPLLCSGCPGTAGDMSEPNYNLLFACLDASTV